MAKKPLFQRVIVPLNGLLFLRQAAVNTFQLPDGTEGCWESLHGKGGPGVLIAPLTSSGKLVLVRMFRFPVNDFVFELPGGQINKGERPENAAKRELLEETGYGTDEPFERLAGGYMYNSKSNAKFWIYLARNCRKIQDPVLDPVEQFAGVKVAEQTLQEIMREITLGNMRYDPPISQALLALIARGIVKV